MIPRDSVDSSIRWWFPKPVWTLVLDTRVVDPKVSVDTVTLETRVAVTRVCEYSGIREHIDGSQSQCGYYGNRQYSSGSNSQCGQCGNPKQSDGFLWYYEAQAEDRRRAIFRNVMNFRFL
jgi:hypothetical protein